MAVAEMERLALTFKAERLDAVLGLIQGFQGIHIETGFESSVPHDKKAEIEKNIRETEKNLRDINAALGILKSRERKGFFNFLNNGGEKKFSVTELAKTVGDNRWEDILAEVIATDRRLADNRARRLEIEELRENLYIWEHLKVNPLDFKRLHRATALFGSVHGKHAEEFSENLVKQEEHGIYFEETAAEGDRAYYLLVCHLSAAERLGIITEEFSFSAEEYPFDKPQGAARAELDSEEASLVEDEKEITELIFEQEKYGEMLAFAEDYNLNNLLRMKKSLEVTYDGGEIALDGWVTAEMSGRFERLLEKNVPRDDYLLLLSPVTEKDIGDVPIKLKNNRLVSVYENLTEMYSLPRYDEIDPTPVMTVFYLIFFGMMVADAGYGLAVFLVGLAVKKIFNVSRGTKNFMNFLFYLSFPIMAWGALYGSFFGLRLPFGLISPTADIITMIIISVALGYLHIMAGLALQTANLIKHKKYAETLTGGLAWFVTFLGGGLALSASALPFDIPGAFFTAGLILIAAGLAMIILIPAAQYKKRWYAGIGKGLYSLYGATSYLGDFVSYTRLMALGVAGGSVSLAFNTILSYLPLAARFSFGILLAVILHVINLFLSMLSAYVHGIRLQFIEFFSKFYTGGGKKFTPFKAAEKNVIIAAETTEGEWQNVGV